MMNNTTRPTAPSFKVHVGYTRTGRNRWRRFATLADASAFCSAIFAKTGIVLSITQGRQ